MGLLDIIRWIIYGYEEDFDEDKFVIVEKDRKDEKKSIIVKQPIPVLSLTSRDLGNSIQRLKKKGIPERQTDFTPTTGVLGELHEYFIKNEIVY